MTRRICTAHRTLDFGRTDHSAGHRGLLSSVVLFLAAEITTTPEADPAMPEGLNANQREAEPAGRIDSIADNQHDGGNDKGNKQSGCH